MSINVGLAYSQASELKEYAAQLKSMRSKLIASKDMLNQYWQSAELQYINQAIGNIDKKLLQTADRLEGLNSSIQAAAQEKHREEEAARIAAEKAAAEQAAKEAATKEVAKESTKLSP